MRPSYFRILSIIVVVLIFSIISLPDYLSMMRPLWILLFILYIQVIVPAAFQVSVIVFLGIIMDVMSSSVLGSHTLALVLVAWSVSGRARRFKFFSMAQQMAWVFVLSMVYQLTLCLLTIMLGLSMDGLFSFILPVFMTTCIWPWFRTCVDPLFRIYARA